MEVPNEPKRTLVLLGRSRTGKSNIAQVIQDSKYIPPPLNLYSATRTPKSHRIGGLTIIDTPGFFDQLPLNGISKRLTNDMILSMLQEQINCLDLSTTTFAFVFNVRQGINAEDIQSIQLIKRRFPLISQRCMLVLTHCEEKSEDEKESLIGDFFSSNMAKELELEQFFRFGVFYMGSIRNESVANGDRQAISFEQKNTQEMRDALLRFIFSEQPFVHFNSYQREILTTRKKVLICGCSIVILLGICVVLICRFLYDWCSSCDSNKNMTNIGGVDIVDSILQSGTDPS